MNNSLLSGTLQYDLTQSPKVFTFTDTTDYAGQNIALSQVDGLLMAIDPNGLTFHNNTNYASPDVDANISLTTGEFPLPLDTNGKVKVGVYQFIYSIRVSNEVQIHAIVANDLPAKTIYIQGDFTNEIAQGLGFIIVDTVNTNLTLVSYTYDSVSNQTVIVVNQNFGVLTDLATFRYTLTKYYTKTITLDYQYQTPTVCLDWQVNMDCSSMSIVDTTIYPEGSTVTRLHTVHYPDGIEPPKDDIESPLQTLNIAPIWTGTFTDTFTADIEYESGILNVTDSVRKVREMKVSADGSLCGLYSCIESMVKEYAACCTTAPRKAEQIQKNIAKAYGALMCYIIGQRCGKSNYKDYINIIKQAATDCGCDCGCDDCQDDTPVQVVGICGQHSGESSNIIVIESPLGSITIQSETVGDTTTFELDVDSDYLGNFIVTFLGTQSINIFGDVNTITDPPQIGESLVWNGVAWVPNNAQLMLKQLLDVLDTLNPTDGQVLYWDDGDELWKAKTITIPPGMLATLTDVDLELVLDKANWDPTMVFFWDEAADKWYAARNLLENHTDVNTAGLSDGDVLIYKNIAPGEFEWQKYTPVKALNDLNDVDAPTPTDGDSLVYKGAPDNEWQNYKPSYINTGIVWASGYTDLGILFPVYAVGYMYDKTQKRVYCKGGINNAVGSFTGNALLFTLPASAPRPDRIIRTSITTISPLGTVEIHPATVGSTGEVRILDHLDGFMYIDNLFYDVP